MRMGMCEQTLTDLKERLAFTEAKLGDMGAENKSALISALNKRVPLLFVYHRSDLEHTFFSDIFRNFAAKCLQNFNKFYQISLKSSNLGIICCKFAKILRNSGKNRLNFDENFKNLLSFSKIRKKLRKFAEKWCECVKNHRSLEWCKGKSVEFEKC